MKFYKKPDSPFWWVDIRIDGTRHRESTKQVSKQKARTIGENIERELLAGNDPRSVRVKPPTLSEYSSRFLKRIEDGRLTQDTKNYYNGGWRLLKEQPIALLRVTEITTGATERIHVSGSGSNLNMALRTLSRMLNMAMEEDNLLQRVPRIPLAEEKQRERLVNAEEERTILATSTRTLHDAYLLIMDEGMRPKEVCSLVWSTDVDFVRGVLLVTRGKTGRKSRRHLPMTSRVRAMLLERAKLTEGKAHVFPSPLKTHQGQPIKSGSLTNQFSALKRLHGWPDDLVLYSARHTFGTDLMNATGNLPQTQKMMGHTSVTTTSRYMHPGIADVGTIMDERNAARAGHDFGHGTETVQ